MLIVIGYMYGLRRKKKDIIYSLYGLNNYQCLMLKLFQNQFIYQYFTKLYIWKFILEIESRNFQDWQGQQQNS